MSELETQILRQMQTPAPDGKLPHSPLQVDSNGSAPGPSHLRERIAGTERLVDQRTLEMDEDDRRAKP